MAIPQDHKELYAYLSAQLDSKNCANKELLQTIRKLMFSIEEGYIKSDRNDHKIIRTLFTPEIDFEIVNELCSHIHHVLAHLDENYDKDLNPLSYDDCLRHVSRIQEIRDEHFKGENWDSITKMLQFIGVITFISSIVTFSITLPLLIPAGLFLLSAMSMAGAMFSEKKGFNYSVASKLSFFEPENLSLESDLDSIECIQLT